MDLGIKDRTAFITGGAGTLGLAVAQRLAREQARIVICDANEEAIARAVGILEGEGAHVLGCRADVTSRDEVGAAVARAQERFGGVDILVNNAGFARDAYLTRMKEEDWQAVLDVTLQGAFHCSRAVLPGMMQNRFGRIVNIASRAHRGNPGQTNYSAAKAGLIGFTRSLALESGKFGITANAVAPGVISTPRMRQRADYETLTERARQNTPVARLGDPEDVAATVAFLASTLAGFITGETVHVTGGRS
ncbi:3-oxoacyl-ACP reductase FabG [Pigmentiphaga sp. GD03639]|uniref:3-oxoacyl-ACP reductase FabG n=1 Tax=Pigmentiphaga daeguensis TaxID=414049 RepID=A0ABN1C3K0_9BURK|nr:MULTISPECIES: 3-oxoacyl-ACP reductase FabG [unclassified Pigmentiphaga]MDH2239385.1 3-oxoacyl-ACP reductase FabG [Pigmentiphaga sp. GD03639]OVZ65387.1 beta-ketoacyl-ACP reductase [Pigmentiphaga sp. NML030171]